MTSERISYWLKLTRTDFNGMWWSFFFSSFNLCRPVCCRTCHCPSLLKFHFFFRTQAIWYLIGIPFCLRPRSMYVSSFFLFLKQINARKKKRVYTYICIYLFHRPPSSSSLYWLDYSATNIDTNKVILTNICTRVCVCNIDRARSTFVRFVIQIVTGTNLWQAGSLSLSLSSLICLWSVEWNQ